jgi:hypothetical protein
MVYLNIVNKKITKFRCIYTDLPFVMYLNIANPKITKFRCISLDVPFFVVYLNIVNIKLQNSGTSNRLLLVYLNIVNIKLQNSGTSNRLLLAYLNIVNKKITKFRCIYGSVVCHVPKYCQYKNYQI